MDYDISLYLEYCKVLNTSPSAAVLATLLDIPCGSVDPHPESSIVGTYSRCVQELTTLSEKTQQEHHIHTSQYEILQKYGSVRLPILDLVPVLVYHPNIQEYVVDFDIQLDANKSLHHVIYEILYNRADAEEVNTENHPTAQTNKSGIQHNVDILNNDVLLDNAEHKEHEQVSNTLSGWLYPEHIHTLEALSTTLSMYLRSYLVSHYHRLCLQYNIPISKTSGTSCI